MPAPPRFPLFLGKKTVPVSLRSAGALAMLTAAAGSPGGLGGRLLHCGLEKVGRLGAGCPCVVEPGNSGSCEGGQLQAGRCQLFTPRKQQPSRPACISLLEEKKMKRVYVYVCVAFEGNKTESRIDEQEGLSD